MTTRQSHGYFALSGKRASQDPMSWVGETITIVFVPPERIRPRPDQVSAAHRYTTLLIARDGWGGCHIAHRIAPFRNAEADQGRPHQRQSGERKRDIISPGEIVQLPGQPDTQPSPHLVRQQ